MYFLISLSITRTQHLELLCMKIYGNFFFNYYGHDIYKFPIDIFFTVSQNILQDHKSGHPHRK